MRKNIIQISRFLFSFVMLFALVFTCTTGEAIAATTYTEGDYYYEVQDESIVITGYFGSDTEITVPGRIAGYPVSKIASGAFVQASTVTKINLPDTIMVIEEGAFSLEQTIVYNSNMANPDQPTNTTQPDNPIQPANPTQANHTTQPANTKQPNNSTQESTAEDLTSPTQSMPKNTGTNPEEINVENMKTDMQQGEKPGSVEEVDFDVNATDGSPASLEDAQVNSDGNILMEDSGNELEGNRSDKQFGIIVVIIFVVVILGAVAGAGFFRYYIQKGKKSRK